MKLTKVHVTEFKSIRNSYEFDVEDITCLVGKNESGKTAILQALYRLNPIEVGKGNFSITDDYPRSDVVSYQRSIQQGQNHACVIKAIFELDNDEIKLITDKYGKKAINSKFLTLSKGYDNKLYFELRLNDKEILNYLIDNAGISQETSKNFKQQSSIEDTIAVMKAGEQSEEIKKLIMEFEQLKDVGIVTHVYKSFLQTRIPKFLYFDEYYQMEGCANVESLITRQNEKKLRTSDYPLIGLINLAGLDLKQLLSLTRTQELKNSLEGASNHLTQSTIDYWSQNKHLRMQFDVRQALQGDPEGMREGTNIWAEVNDKAHFVSTGLGTRSRGFVWFFSFLAWYSDLIRRENTLILLLDEPGLFLHAKAQEDLLRYFEAQIKGKNQLVYTTHSPFMVDPQHFERVRIVEDKSIDSDVPLSREEQGTKVYTDLLKVSDDSLFPLQGALGYEIHQTLFVGPNCLIVEGVSDLLYIQLLTSILERKGREGLDKQWTVTPVGGSDKVPTFVALLGAQKGLNLATLIDFNKNDSQKIENLYKNKLLESKKVLTFAEYVKKDSADIEDMFENEFYLKLVNEEYKISLTKKIKITDLNNNLPRIIVQLTEYFNENPMKEGTQYTHFRPARFLSENISDLQNEISDATLDRFESAFKKLNSLLPKN